MFRCVAHTVDSSRAENLTEKASVIFRTVKTQLYYLLNISRKPKPRKMDIRTCYKYEDNRTTQWQWSPPAHLSSAIMCPFPITHYTLETTPVVKYA